MATHAILTMVKRTSTHDGYCSDTECENTVEVFFQKVPLPPELVSQQLKAGYPILDLHYFDAATSAGILEYAGSGYCTAGYWDDVCAHEFSTAVCCAVAVEN